MLSFLEQQKSMPLTVGPQTTFSSPSNLFLYFFKGKFEMYISSIWICSLIYRMNLYQRNNNIFYINSLRARTISYSLDPWKYLLKCLSVFIKWVMENYLIWITLLFPGSSLTVPFTKDSSSFHLWTFALAVPLLAILFILFLQFLV